MKHVGLNVAADPLMTLAYVGTKGGFVVLVADDPGMNSSQNEQDTRHFARFAKIPILEPSDSQEAKDFMGFGLEVSEKFTTPVILRSTTRISHSRSQVKLGERVVPDREIAFVKDPPRYVPIPAWARRMRVRLEDRLNSLKAECETSPLNRIEWRDRKLGIITAGVSYTYVREAFPEASVLKVGWSYPFPDKLFHQFAEGVEKVLVVEELEDFMEEHVRSLGIPCIGRELVPGIGELSVPRLLEIRARMEGKPVPAAKPFKEAADLPGRPPVLCAGCPHRAIYHALSKYDVVVTGDIGCYSLGVLQPSQRFDTILCMGAGISMAHGVQKAGEKKPVVGIVGDSTFFHSGVTGLMDIVFNKGNSTILVLDNRTTAMTGHQDHPGSGQNLMGEEVPALSIEELGRACGIKRVRKIDPYDLENAIKVIGEELAADEPSLVVSLHSCPLHEHVKPQEGTCIDVDYCVECGSCLQLGCPALEARGRYLPTVNPELCIACGMCSQVCEHGAITDLNANKIVGAEQ
jgi:indolepyruvate ferredoxin oxidoreductase alpha subunit